MDSPLINYLRLFRHIPAEDASLISEAFKQRAVKEGDVLFTSGHVCKEMFFICNGVLRIMIHNDKGAEVTYFFLKENQFCTILNSFNNEVSTEEGIEAACDGEILVVSKARLIELYQQLPYLKELIDQITQQALLDKIQIKNGYQGYDSTERYKLFLMRQPEIALRVSLTDVASYLGITPQSLSRIRKNIR
ncbi:Crp/Fnr family transcriptional regulator [Mucilaginibacter agri]|uniref:Cyclic nucleotide-binding domain-containing protein n=1 Tax=Mucilaginibacter agri TaxID=2695265 RepID=A0A965ZHF8_9SPHI|nr:Crp/Fnr family transcriptional regulator [Mucilaginibacter agri]NCD71085.1 cyclic nucleotide-binding domain-containing protein [Mucilaginibacter agri]